MIVDSLFDNVKNAAKLANMIGFSQIDSYKCIPVYEARIINPNSHQVAAKLAKHLVKIQKNNPPTTRPETFLGASPPP